MISNTAIVDGITMRWEEAGEGMPVVLIHGIPTSPARCGDTLCRKLPRAAALPGKWSAMARPFRRGGIATYP